MTMTMATAMRMRRKARLRRGLAGVHVPGMSQERIVQIERDILSKNRLLCRRKTAPFSPRRACWR